MDHAISVVAEPAQEGRQHGCGLRLGIVQQDDALARRPAAARSAVSTRCCRRHRIPVAGPEVGAEHGDAARSARCPASRASFQRRESERTACSGWSRPCRAGPFRPPRCPCRSRRWRLPASCISDCDGSRCDARRYDPPPPFVAPVRDVPKPACRSGRRWRARIPAPAPPASSVVVAGQGPSSKVSTTSWSSSGSVCGKLLRPTRGRWQRGPRRERGRGAERVLAGIRQPGPPR